MQSYQRLMLYIFRATVQYTQTLTSNLLQNIMYLCIYLFIYLFIYLLLVHVSAIERGDIQGAASVLDVYSIYCQYSYVNGKRYTLVFIIIYGAEIVMSVCNEIQC
jgi:hypothetical protein